MNGEQCLIRFLVLDVLIAVFNLFVVVPQSLARDVCFSVEFAEVLHHLLLELVDFEVKVPVFVFLFDSFDFFFGDSRVDFSTDLDFLLRV